ncbi:hypothetical protein BG006_003061, partial [Podila minutissima]
MATFALALAAPYFGQNFFEYALPMNLYKEADWGLCIEHMMPNGTHHVFITCEPGQPITLDAPQKKNGHQWFNLQCSQGINKIESSGPNQCIPETTVMIQG